MTTLKVRVRVDPNEPGLVSGAELTGNIYSVDNPAASQRDIVFPVGHGAPAAEFIIAPGRYVVEAALPSGRLLSDEVDVQAGESVPLEFDATASSAAPIVWERILDDVRDGAGYEITHATRLPRSVDARLTRNWIDAGWTGPAPGEAIWCSGAADRGVQYRDILSIIGTQPESAFDLFTTASWVDKADEIQAAPDDDPASESYRFTSEVFPGLDPHTTSGRRFLLVRSVLGRYAVTLPVPWLDTRIGNEVAVEVRVNARRTPLGTPVSVTVGDPAVGAALGYLANGAFAQAAVLFGRVEEMLFQKMANPLSAAAGAYVLAGTDPTRERQRWDDWIDNLDERFPSMSDGAILRAVRLLKTAANPTEVTEARQALLDAAARGLPVYALGISWLLDGLSEFDDGECAAASDLIRRVSWHVDTREPFVTLRLG